MKLLIGIILAFTAIFSGSPLGALLLGITFALFLESPNEFIEKSIGTRLLQAGIVILGLTISASNTLSITTAYFPYISIFVVIVFSLGILISKISRVDSKLSILIVSGTAICGATAIAAISPLIKAKPNQLLTSLAVIFLLNAIAIAIFPIIGNNIGMSDEQFGSWMAMAVHDTSSVIGAAVSFGGGAVEIAAPLKLARTLWLIPLIIVLGVFYKDKKNTRNTFPLFIFTFILAIFVGNQLNLSDMTSSFLKDASSALLIGALFCIGTQINSKSIKNIELKTIFFALLLWLFAIAASYYLVKVL